MDPVIRLFRDLVAIDSVNPGLAPGVQGEGPIAAAIASEMLESGLDVEVCEVAPGRPNVIGVLDGRRPERIGLSFWTHAARLGPAGIPAVVFGRGGGGLPSIEEFVRVDDVLACRHALAGVARAYCA